jgi:hypothetical protein
LKRLVEFPLEEGGSVLVEVESMAAALTMESDSVAMLAWK